MGGQLKPGDRVAHPEWGEGKVQSVYGDRLVVLFDYIGLALDVGATDIQREGDSEESHGSGLSVHIPPFPLAVPSEPSNNRRASVEALRFGLVPEAELRHLTVGFEAFRDWVLDRLPEPMSSPSVSEVSGPFGSGKSHALAVVRALAREQNYLTARVEVDGKSVSLSNPERLLCALWSTLESRERRSPTPIFDLCETAIKRGGQPPRIAPRGIDRLHDNYLTADLLRQCKVQDEFGHILDSVMSSSPEYTAADAAREISRHPAVPAYDVHVRRVIGQSVRDRPFDFVEAWIGYAELARLAGFRGLVITIDEFEVEHFLARSMLPRVEVLVGALIDYFAGQLNYPDVPLAVFFASVGEEGHAGDALIEALIEAGGGEIQQLSSWQYDDIRSLAEHISDLYCAAYGLSFPFEQHLFDAAYESVEGDASAAPVRSFIKAFVGVLDSVHGPRGLGL